MLYRQARIALESLPDTARRAASCCAMRSDVHQMCGLSSFVSEPTIPDTFQPVDWHQLL